MFDEASFENHEVTMPVRSFRDALIVLDHVLTKAIEFDTTAMVACPISAILNYPAETEAGSKALKDPRLNNALKKILTEWSKFLKTSASCTFLNEQSPTGWFCKEALDRMPHFTETYVCDPSKTHWGFTSWDDFFTRHLRPSARPVDDADDDRIINNACESAPYDLITGVKEKAAFWAKSQPYSLHHIFHENPMDEHFHQQFIGGTIYQAYLSPMCYHRWHSPVNGKIVKYWTIPGTYFADAPDVRNAEDGSLASLRYLSEVATRTIVLIEANNPEIGLMAFVAIGMDEVSSCEVTVTEGQSISKGQQLGMFHFGGSTHLLIFRPECRIEFDCFAGRALGPGSEVFQINKRLARIRNKPSHGT